MKYLLPLMMISSIASAAPSVAEVESLIKAKQYPQAEVALEAVVAEQPKSAKAHYYLSQVYQVNGNTVDAKAEMQQYYVLRPPLKTPVYKPQPVQQEDDSGGLWVVFLFLAIVIGIVAIMLNLDEVKEFVHKKWNAKDIAAKQQKRKDDLLRRSNQAKSKARSSISMLKVHGMQQTLYFPQMMEYSEALTDAIECLTKNSDCNLRDIEQMLNDFDYDWSKLQSQLP